MAAIQHTSLRDTAVLHLKIATFTEGGKKGKIYRKEHKPKKNALILNLAQRGLNLLWGYYIHSLLQNKIGSLGKMNCAQRLDNPIKHKEKLLIKPVVVFPKELR